jgi:hypothetical protein
VVSGWAGGLRVLNQFFGGIFEIQRANDTQRAVLRNSTDKKSILAPFNGI